MASCTFDITSVLRVTSRVEDTNSDYCLFQTPFTAADIENNYKLRDQLMSGFLQRIYHVFEDFQLDAHDINDMIKFCNILMSFKQTAKYDAIIGEIDALLSRLPSLRTLEEDIDYSYKILTFTHAWLMLRFSQLTITFRNLPESITLFYNLIDTLMEDLINLEYTRINARSFPDKGSSNTLLKSKNDFQPPQKLGRCDCIASSWRFLLSTISQAFSQHQVTNKSVWDVFNSAFNNIAGSNQVMNISALVWIFEQVSTLAMDEIPQLPPNWSPLQELVKQSCSHNMHLPQTLATLINMNTIWQPQIIIIMTLQQEFFRQLTRCDVKTIVLELDPQQYISAIDSVGSDTILESGSTFQKFLQFYTMSLLKIPEVKRLSLIKRVFNCNRQTLCSMSLESFQNYGLWIGGCLCLAKPGSISTQINQIFASQSGDLISSSRFPNAVISLQIAIILLHAKFEMEYDHLVEHVAVMLARLVEDYIRSDAAKKNVLFGHITKSFDYALFLHDRGIRLTPTAFFGSWIGILLEEGKEQRLVRMLQFVDRIMKASASYCREPDIKATQQFFVKPILKYLQGKNDKDKVLLESIASVLANFSAAVVLFPQFKNAYYQQLISNLITKHPFSSLYLSFNFTHAILLHEKSAVLCKDNETKFCNVIFIVLSEYYVLHDPSIDTKEHQNEKLCKLIPFLVSTLPFKMDIEVSGEDLPSFPLNFISKLGTLFSSLSFSDAQIFKDFIWKVVSGLSGALFSLLLVKPSESSLNRLFSYLAKIFDTIPHLLFSSNKDNSPLIELFNTFFTPKLSSLPTEIRKSRTAVLPRVFTGLASLSYKSNNMFFKDILKVFDDVYPQVSASDWKNNREVPFLTRLFSFSFNDSLEKPPKSFRKSFMLHLTGSSSGYLNSDNLSKTSIFVFFLLKLETQTTDLELLLFDFQRLYPFLLQVLLKSAVSKPHDSELESNITALTRYLLLKLRKEFNLQDPDKSDESNHIAAVNQTQTFISTYAYLGCKHIIDVLTKLVGIGGHSIVAQTLEHLENHLNGKNSAEYEKLQNEIINRMK